MRILQGQKPACGRSTVYSVSPSRRHVGKDPRYSLYCCSSFNGTGNHSHAHSRMRWEEAWAQRDNIGVLACLLPYACAPPGHLASILPNDLAESVLELQNLGAALVAAVVEPIYCPPWVRERMVESDPRGSTRSDSRSSCSSSFSLNGWKGSTPPRQILNSGDMGKGKRRDTCNIPSIMDCGKAVEEKMKGKRGVQSSPDALLLLSSSRICDHRHISFSLLRSLSKVIQCKLAGSPARTHEGFIPLPFASSFASTLPLWISLCALCVAENDEEALDLANLIAQVFPEAAGCALIAYCSVQAAAGTQEFFSGSASERNQGRKNPQDSAEPRYDKKYNTTPSTEGTASMIMEEHWVSLWKKVRKWDDGEKMRKSRTPFGALTTLEGEIFDTLAVRSWLLAWEVHCSLVLTSMPQNAAVDNTTRSRDLRLVESFSKVNLNSIAQILSRHIRSLEGSEKCMVQSERNSVQSDGDACDPSSSFSPSTSQSFTALLPSGSFFAPQSVMLPLMSQVLRKMPIFSQVEWVREFPLSSVLYQYGGPENVVLLCYSQVCNELLESAVAFAKDLHLIEERKREKRCKGSGPFGVTALDSCAERRPDCGQAVFSVRMHPATSLAVVQTRLLQYMLFRAVNLVVSRNSYLPSSEKNKDTDSEFPGEHSRIGTTACATPMPNEVERGAYATFLSLLKEMSSLWAVHNPHAIAASLVPPHESHSSSLQDVMVATRSTVRASRTADLVGSILIGMRWLCTGDVDGNSSSFRYEKQNANHIPLSWRREWQELVHQAVKEAVRLLTALLSLCANKEGSLPTRRALPAWRVKLAATSAVRSHKYELLLSELPHQHLASILALLLHYGFMEEAVTLSCCIVKNNQLDLSAYPATLIGSMWLSVSSAISVEDGISGEKFTPAVSRSKTCSAGTLTDDVVSRLAKFYRQRILVFCDSEGSHEDDVSNAVKGESRKRIGKQDAKNFSTLKMFSTSGRLSKKDAHSENAPILSSMRSWPEARTLHSLEGDAGKERISLVGSSSSFFCSTLSSKVIWRAKEL